MSDPSGKSWLTGAEGFSKYIGISAAITAAIIAAPVAIPAAALTAGAVLGLSAVGYGTYSNYQAYTNGQISKDQFDYNAGALLGGVIPLGGLGRIGTNTVGVPKGSNLRFSQTSVDGNFSISGNFKGASLSDVINEIKSGNISPENIAVNYLETGGYRVMENNRSATVLIKAGVPESKWNLNSVSENSEAGRRIQNHLTDPRSNLSATGTSLLKIRSN